MMTGKHCVIGASAALAIAALVQRLTLQTQTVEMDAPRNHFRALVGRRQLAQLREAAEVRPGDGAVRAQLALALLEPVDEVAPNTDEESLYGPGLTLIHPNLAESRRLMEEALNLAPDLPETHLAHQAVLTSEGNGEDAIQPGRKAIELTPQSGLAYASLARSHLMAACAQGCQARNDYRRERKAERLSGRKSPLEAREAEAAKRQERAKAKERGEQPPMDRGSLKAGAMWRLMEAGRLLADGAKAEPSNKDLKKLAKRSRGLTKLDGHKVLSTEEIIKHGECHRFFGQARAPARWQMPGLSTSLRQPRHSLATTTTALFCHAQELNGEMCDKRRYAYE